MDERLIELEKRQAFQDNMIEELNEVIIQQEKRISALEAQTVAMKEQMASANPMCDISEEEPPPHY
ncbi:MAG: SlyX protein [Lysobacterales bacterium]|jgi:SlyX protein